MGKDNVFIGFTPDNYEEKVWVNASEICIIQPLKKERNTASLSTIIMKNGVSIGVIGSPDKIVESISQLVRKL